MIEQMKWEAAVSRIPVLTPKQQASELLTRYPDIGEQELNRLIEAYRNMSALDVALLLSDEVQGPKLTRFREENKKGVRTPLKQYAVLVGIAYGGLALIAWAMMVAW